MTSDQVQAVRDLAAAAQKLLDTVDVKPVSVEDVYGKPPSEIKAPDGYELTGEFRVPALGEYFLAYLFLEAAKFADGMTWNYEYCKRIAYSGPRLILRKKPKRRKWVVEETGEERQARKGEWYMDADLMRRWDLDLNTVEKYPILSVKEVAE